MSDTTLSAGSKANPALDSAIKKAAKHLMPMLVILYFVAFLDRTNVGFAEDALSYLFVLRVIGLLPAFMVNAVPGALRVPLAVPQGVWVFGLLAFCATIAPPGPWLGPGGVIRSVSFSPWGFVVLMRPPPRPCRAGRRRSPGRSGSR